MADALRIPFAPPPGLNSDDTSFSAEGRWADGNNVRFKDGKAEPLGGSERFTLNDGAPVVSNCLPGTPNGSMYFAFGLWAVTRSGIFYVSGGDFDASPPQATSVDDRTPAGITEINNPWSFASWGNDVLAGDSLGAIYRCAYPFSADFAEIAQAPDKSSWMIVTPQRQVMAFACSEEVSGTQNGRCIRWSDVEDYADWTTSSSKLAGEVIIDDIGSIVTARNIGPYIGVWTGFELLIGEFTGDASQPYRFDKVAIGCGVISAYGVVVDNGWAYWMSPDHKIWRWAPGGLPEEVPCPISRMIRADDPGAAFATTMRSFSEIWFCYGSSKYVAFSSKDGSWHGGHPGSGISASGFTAMMETRTNNRIICMKSESATNTSLWMAERGHAFGSEPMTWSLRSAAQYLDEGGQEVQVQGIEPDFEDQEGSINLTLHVRDKPQGTAVPKGPYILAEGAEKRDFRATGKIIEVEFSNAATQDDSFARFGKHIFLARPGGRR